MRPIATSMIARGGLSVFACAGVLMAGWGLAAAVAAIALSRIVVLVAYDGPRASRGEPWQWKARADWRILRAAVPLGVVLMLGSLTANVPRYAIEQHIGTLALGVFAAAFSFVTIGSTMVNALGQSATSRLSTAFDNDRAAFRRLALRVVALAAAVGLAGAACAVAIGPWALATVYRPEYAAYAPVLTAAMGASVAMYAAAALGYVTTSTRSFGVQMPLAGLAAAVCALVSWLLVPRWGLLGAPAALAVAAVVQIAGHAAIQWRRGVWTGAAS